MEDTLKVFSGVGDLLSLYQPGFLAALPGRWGLGILVAGFSTALTQQGCRLTSDI